MSMTSFKAAQVSSTIALLALIGVFSQATRAETKLAETDRIAPVKESLLYALPLVSNQGLMAIGRHLDADVFDPFILQKDLESEQFSEGDVRLIDTDQAKQTLRESAPLFLSNLARLNEFHGVDLQRDMTLRLIGLNMVMSRHTLESERVPLIGAIHELNAQSPREKQRKVFRTAAAWAQKLRGQYPYEVAIGAQIYDSLPVLADEIDILPSEWRINPSPRLISRKVAELGRNFESAGASEDLASTDLRKVQIIYQLRVLAAGSREAIDELVKIAFHSVGYVAGAVIKSLESIGSDNEEIRAKVIPSIDKILDKAVSDSSLGAEIVTNESGESVSERSGPYQVINIRRTGTSEAIKAGILMLKIKLSPKVIEHHIHQLKLYVGDQKYGWNSGWR
jgi:hypothetical protein